MSNNQNKIVVFFDAVGRTIVGEEIESETSDKILAVKNLETLFKNVEIRPFFPFQ